MHAMSSRSSIVAFVVDVVGGGFSVAGGGKLDGVEVAAAVVLGVMYGAGLLLAWYVSR
jgi:hypothetical protein